MPRSYWCVLITFVGVALAGASPPNQNANQANTGSNQTDANAATYQPYPKRNEEACYKASNHDAADLCAQWSAADAAKDTAGLTYWGNWIAGVGATLSFLSVILVLIALRQGRRANEIAQEGTYRDLRAYLSAEVISTGVASDILSGEVIIKNAGQTPAALRVFVRAWVGPHPTNHPVAVGPEPEEEPHHHPYINRGGFERVSWFYAAEDWGADQIKKVADPDDSDWAIMVYGFVEFTDFMRRDRVLHFSYRNSVGVEFGETFEMVPTPQGNHYEDRGYKPPKRWRDNLRAIPGRVRWFFGVLAT